MPDAADREHLWAVHDAKPAVRREDRDDPAEVIGSEQDEAFPKAAHPGHEHDCRKDKGQDHPSRPPKEPEPIVLPDGKAARKGNGRDEGDEDDEIVAP